MNTFLFIGFLQIALISSALASPFVKVQNNGFIKDNRPYEYVGANFWQAMNIAAKDKKQLTRELDTLLKHGMKQLRIMAISEGPATAPYRAVPAVLNSPTDINHTMLEALDFVLAEMSKRNMTAILVLNNFWPWSGGMAQWVSWSEGSSIPYPPPHPGGSWSKFQEYSSRFYTIPKAVEQNHQIIQKLVTRINSVTKKAYVNDPTIMAWQLANEPRGGKYRKEFLEWIKSTSKLIKSLDKNHLVSLGSEGETPDPKDAGNNFVLDHSIYEIDYATIHIWVENWGFYNPVQGATTMPGAINYAKSYMKDHIAKLPQIKKPLVLEEFGMARDGRSMDPYSPTTQRDYYFGALFQAAQDLKEIKGINIWAYSGEARPSQPYGGLWKVGDDFLGDPAHEEQGWYGVYDTDSTTLNLIKSYSDFLKK